LVGGRAGFDRRAGPAVSSGPLVAELRVVTDVGADTVEQGFPIADRRPPRRIQPEVARAGLGVDSRGLRPPGPTEGAARVELVEDVLGHRGVTAQVRMLGVVE